MGFGTPLGHFQVQKRLKEDLAITHRDSVYEVSDLLHEKMSKPLTNEPEGRGETML